MSDGGETSSIRIRVRQRRGFPSAPRQDVVADEGDNAEAPYAVGYKRPPKHSQFTRGHSGNPKGRPRGSKNWSTIIAEAARRRRTIGLGGKKVRMSGSEAIAEQMVINAIKGDPKARRDFLNEMRFDRQREAAALDADASSQALASSDEALLADFLRRAGKTQSRDESS